MGGAGRHGVADYVCRYRRVVEMMVMEMMVMVVMVMVQRARQREGAGGLNRCTVDGKAVCVQLVRCYSASCCVCVCVV